jgi:hypothetical protein
VYKRLERVPVVVKTYVDLSKDGALLFLVVIQEIYMENPCVNTVY